MRQKSNGRRRRTDVKRRSISKPSHGETRWKAGSQTSMGRTPAGEDHQQTGQGKLEVIQCCEAKEHRLADQDHWKEECK